MMPDYGEPWDIEDSPYCFILVDRDGGPLLSEVGDGNPYGLETFYATFEDHGKAKRAIACVNACAGIRDPEKVVKSWAEVVRLHSLGMDDKTFGYAVRKLVEAKDE